MTQIKSRISPKVEIRKSKINDKGMFAKENIKKDEMVFIKGGHILTRKELFTSTTINSYLPISDDYFLGATTPDEEDSIKLFINHSCDANCGVRGEITFVAMRDINANEELTIDYALVDNEDYEIGCNCESKHCRKKVTGYDWKLPEVQKKYVGYFARYLKDKIEN
ncbi:MAG: SET domain-containing protein-lysine N-methyltransferase [Patescibacteria group bacterium]|nr:SET domain-containing protein-lysine N-methyltransferase [Patescibacteria group bacterium]